MSVFCLYGPVYHMHVWCTQGPKEDIRFLGTVVTTTDSRELPYGAES